MSEDKIMIMAKRIHDKRNEYGFTMEELGNMVGVQKSAVNKWEKGSVSNIKRSVIEKLAQIFECSPTWLMGIDEEEHYYIDDEAREIAEFMHNNPEYRVLFDASRRVSKKDIEMVKALLDRFKSDDEN